MLLICSAWEEEVKYLSSTVNGQRSTVNGQQIASLGIGYLEAALRLNNILRDANYSRIIFLGTAGAYSNELQIGEIVSVSQVALLNLGMLLGDSYIPREYDSYTSSPLTTHHSVTVNCLSSLEITNNETLSGQIINFQTSCQPSTINYQLVENLELYGVAKVACEHNIPWSALLGITNYTNSNAHADWKANHERISEKLCESLDPYKYKSLT